MGVHQIIRIILIYYYVNVKLIDRCVKLKSLSHCSVFEFGKLRIFIIGSRWSTVPF